LASRFSLEGNPQLERDWPTLPFAYEDEAHQRLSEDLAFTLVDFAACDRRLARRFVTVLPPQWTDDMVPVASFLAAAPEESFAKAPSLMMVDRSNRLRKAIVDGKMIAEARRCLQAWRGLQELGGVNNSHAARALARQREISKAPIAPEAPSPATTSAAADAPIEAAPERSLDEPYIETARCTSCNECKLINDKMFGYDANKQAAIVDPDAGTYRELVEAAENCQVSIIHPGKPRNPNEPGLEELFSRAQAFL
jgi:ferredoxin